MLWVERVDDPAAPVWIGTYIRSFEYDFPLGDIDDHDVHITDEHGALFIRVFGRLLEGVLRLAVSEDEHGILPPDILRDEPRTPDDVLAAFDAMGAVVPKAVRDPDGLHLIPFTPDVCGGIGRLLYYRDDAAGHFRVTLNFGTGCDKMHGYVAEVRRYTPGLDPAPA